MRGWSHGQAQGGSTYSYDLVGNRNGSTDSVGTGNRQLRVGNYRFEYDDDGNLTRKYTPADTTAFNQRFYWNHLNQLDSARYYQSGWQTVRFGYDAWGRRVRKNTSAGTTYYVWSGDHVVAEYASGSLVRHYTYYSGADRPHSVQDASARHYFMSDGAANVTGWINSAGSSIELFYRYTPFGEVDSSSGSASNSVRYAGRELDLETGLYYNRARFYDPQIGRFISQDPVGFAGGINPYTFAENDPINGRDPSGNRCEWRREEDAAVVAASAGSGKGREYLYCWDLVGPSLMGGSSRSIWGPSAFANAFGFGQCDLTCQIKREGRSQKGGFFERAAGAAGACRAEIGRALLQTGIDGLTIAGSATGAGLAARGGLSLLTGGVGMLVGSMPVRAAFKSAAGRVLAAGAAEALEGLPLLALGAGFVFAANDPRLTAQMAAGNVNSLADFLPIGFIGAIGGAASCIGDNY